MLVRTSGLQHVTAIGGRSARSVDRYRTLGSRLVKTIVDREPEAFASVLVTLDAPEGTRWRTEPLDHGASA